jgi:hypothetical protein
MQIREAVSAAQTGLVEVFPATRDKELRLEAIEKTDDDRYWQVTFSYSTSADPSDPLSRVYKTVKLRDHDGELMGARTGFLFDAA